MIFSYCFFITTPDNESIYVDIFKVIRMAYKNPKSTHFQLIFIFQLINLYGMNKGYMIIYKNIMFEILRMKALWSREFLFGGSFCSLLS